MQGHAELDQSSKQDEQRPSKSHDRSDSSSEDEYSSKRGRQQSVGNGLAPYTAVTDPESSLALDEGDFAKERNIVERLACAVNDRRKGVLAA